MFDIDSYYQSITPELFEKSTKISRKRNKYNQTRDRYYKINEKTLIKYDNILWKRKGRNNNFDITMGSPDSAEITDLVVLYILKEIN